MEVGIEDCLHIEFEYDKSAYHLQDVVIGKVRHELDSFIKPAAVTVRTVFAPPLALRLGDEE